MVKRQENLSKEFMAKSIDEDQGRAIAEIDYVQSDE